MVFGETAFVYPIGSGDDVLAVGHMSPPDIILEVESIQGDLGGYAGVLGGVKGQLSTSKKSNIDRTHAQAGEGAQLSRSVHAHGRL